MFLARFTDKISGVHKGAIVGYISEGSDHVLIGGLPVATITCRTYEVDKCGISTGMINEGSSRLFINGLPIARMGDSVKPHGGTALIADGSEHVMEV